MKEPDWRDEQIAKQKTEIQRQSRKLTELSGALAKHEAEVRSLQRELTARDRLIAELRSCPGGYFIWKEPVP